MKHENFTPKYDRVLIRRLPDDDTEARFVVAKTAKEPPLKGVVLAVGRGRLVHGELVPLETKPGTTVLFGKYAGSEINLNGEDLLIMRDEEILGEFHK